MAAELDFGVGNADFGEPTIAPAGISFGKVAFAVDPLTGLDHRDRLGRDALHDRGAERPARLGQRHADDPEHAEAAPEDDGDPATNPNPPARHGTITVLHGGGNRALPGGAMGGDTFVVTGGGGPASPLVIYGDTSQDGVWYSGRPGSATDAGDFGPKPYDPFPGIADEDERFLFPLGNPFDHAGNDVIDARAASGRDESALDGRHRRLRWRRRRPDHRHPDRRPSRGRLGERHDPRAARCRPDLRRHRRQRRRHPAGADGPVPRRSLHANRDPRCRERQPLRRRRGQRSSTTPGARGEFDDVVFGDYGIVTQDVSHALVGLAASPTGGYSRTEAPPQRIQTTRRILVVETTRYADGGVDTIAGNAGDDFLLGGAQGDLIDGHRRERRVRRPRPDHRAGRPDGVQPPDPADASVRQLPDHHARARRIDRPAGRTRR